VIPQGRFRAHPLLSEPLAVAWASFRFPLVHYLDLKTDVESRSSQSANGLGRFVLQQGGAQKVIVQKQLTPEELAKRLDRVCEHARTAGYDGPPQLPAMGRPDANRIALA